MTQNYKEYLEKARARAKQYYDAHKDDPEFRQRRRDQRKAWEDRQKDASKEKQPQS